MGKIDSKENLIRLVSQYKNLIFSICMKMTGDYFISEDITQETFIQAYQNYDRFDGANEKAWICRIASNRCIDYLRKAERRSIPTSEDEMPVEASPVDVGQLFASRAVLETVENACRRLPENYIEISLQHFVQGMSPKEIALKNRMNLKTVQTQIYRAREMLKKSIRKEDLLS